jgi:hypothetical protein
MDLDLTNVITLMLRLMPVILPSYFLLASIFSQDIKGLIYLMGLLCACFATMLTGETFVNSWGAGVPNPVCHVISLGKGGQPISQIPLSLAVYAYTFFYIVFIIAKYNDFKNNNLWIQNVATIVFLGSLIIFDFLWNSRNQCSHPLGLVLSVVVGGLTGFLWAWIIDSTGSVKLQYFNGLSNRTYCSRPSKQLFKCDTKR